MRTIIFLPFIIILLFRCGKNEESRFKDYDDLIANKVFGEQTGTVQNIIQKINDYDEKKDFEKSAKYKLNINYIYEKRLNTEKKSCINLEQKYKILRNTIKKIFNSTKDEQNDPEHLLKWAYESMNLIYHPLSIREVKKSLDDFGCLYIKETKDANNNPIPQQVNAPRPWSGHWYPFSQNTLSAKENSPLQKYDQLLRLEGNSSLVSEYENMIRRTRLQSSDWEGLCDAWSLASITVPEPSSEKIVRGIRFSIADQKALATFSHLKHPFKQYGLTYTGNQRTDGAYQDIRPEAFHKIITHVLGVQKRALIIDDMSGVQIWNKPLYRYRWKIQKDEEFDNAYVVTGYPWLIKERQQESDQLTNSHDIIAPIYQYRLFVDKENQNDDGFAVVAGQWINESYKDHPDNVKVPLQQKTLGSHNKEFNKTIEIYKRYFLNNES